MGKTTLAIVAVFENRRLRLYISLAFAAVVFVLTYSKSSGTVSFMFTWIAFAFSNLLSSWFLILSAHPRQVKAMADKEDSSGAFIFLLVLIAAFISLFAILFLLAGISNESKQGLSYHIVLSFASVFCSWTLVHTLFTLRYAHLYYTAKDEPPKAPSQPPALSFPFEEEPDYLDFAYFSFVLGMTFQVSDVTINAKNIRRIALLHGFLSFVYNTLIVALSINIVSGVISK